MAHLRLNSNNIADCDFTRSDISFSQIQDSVLSRNTYASCLINNSRFLNSYIERCNINGADLSGTEFKSGGFGKNTLVGAKLNHTRFLHIAIQDIVFEGTLEGCHFENSSLYNGKFQNATLLNSFFKNNRRFKRVRFIDCRVDKLTYAFLKNNLADLTGITLIS